MDENGASVGSEQDQMGDAPGSIEDTLARQAEGMRQLEERIRALMPDLSHLAEMKVQLPDLSQVEKVLAEQREQTARWVQQAQSMLPDLSQVEKVLVGHST